MRTIDCKIGQQVRIKSIEECLKLGYLINPINTRGELQFSKVKRTVYINSSMWQYFGQIGSINYIVDEQRVHVFDWSWPIELLDIVGKYNYIKII